MKLDERFDTSSRLTITKDDALILIKKYGGEYDPTDKARDWYDQLQICESLVESGDYIPEEIKEEHLDLTNKEEDDNGHVDDGDNATCKRNIKSELNASKLQIIEELKKYDCKTPPRIVGKLLQELFSDYDTDKGYWLYVAQHWPPRAINRVLTLIIKQHRRGEISIRNTAKYFTFKIQLRAKRASVRKGGKSR